LVLGLYGACADTQTNRYRQSPDTVSKIVFHASDWGTRRAVQIVAAVIALAKMSASR
jgi:hypothetical protein